MQLNELEWYAEEGSLHKQPVSLRLLLIHSLHHGVVYFESRSDDHDDHDENENENEKGF